MRTETADQFALATLNERISAAIPERVALVWGSKRFTYGELAERSRRLAAYLHAAGLGCHTGRAGLAGHETGQDLLGIYAYNGNEWVESMLGAFKARVAPMNVNYRYVGNELVYLLNDARPAALVYHARFAPVLAEVLGRTPSVRVLLQVADESGNALLPGAVDYEVALASVAPELPPVEPSPDDLYVLYTGGTTGMPKGVLWRQHDIFMSAMGGRTLGSWQAVSTYDEVVAKAETGGFRILILPPLMHGAAQWAAFSTLDTGGTIVLPPVVERLDVADVLGTIEREGVMTVVLVGDAMARPLVEAIEAGGHNLGSLFAVGSGGAALSVGVKERLLVALPHLIVHDGVGSSETGTQMAHFSSKGKAATGRFSPSPDTVVVDADKEALCEPGHEGDGWLGQGGWVPLGYKDDAAKTAATFPVIAGRRYAIPGDRARLLAGGDIELLGRDSVTINSGGEKIFAEEVEAAITSHPAVRDVVVASRPSDRWGQEVVAVVALQPGADVGADEIAEHAAASIARYKLPKAVVFVDDVVRSPAGKADYRWAADQARQAPQAPQAGGQA